MAGNKVEINGKTIIDLTKDTVLPQTLLSGVTAHNAAGEPIVGAVAVAPASATLPKAPGEAAVGEENTFARSDHVHPKEVSDADRAAWNGKPSMVIAEIPKGRMRGDVDGDGKITENDVTELYRHINSGITLTGADLWCADTDANNDVTVSDYDILDRYTKGLSNALTYIPTFADYYNNWTYHKVDDTSGYWTTELSIPAITAETEGSITWNGTGFTGTFIKAEAFSGGVRIYANRPTIEALPCAVSYHAGTGGQFVIANTGVSETYVQDALSSIGARYVVVKLTASGWSDGKEQTISVPGLKASPVKQLIIPTQATSGMDRYYRSGVRISARYDGSLTFSCETIPTEDVTVALVIIPIIGKFE